MCTCKPKYWCTIMYVCEKSLAPHDSCYLRLFNFAHSNFFHVIVIFKSSPKKWWSFIPFFGARIVSEPFIRKYLLSIHCHASNVDNCWKLLDCDNILSTLYTELAFTLSNCLSFNNYLHLLTNWMPSKSFICGGVWACKNRWMSIDHSSALWKLII